MIRTVLIVLLCSTMLTATASARYPFTDQTEQARFQSLLHDLRCPVCQNQDLADSNAAIAADLRQIVYRRILLHQSDAQIRRYLTERYGAYILFKPPMTLLTVLLWFGPLVLLCLGLCVFVLIVKRRSAHE